MRLTLRAKDPEKVEVSDQNSVCCWFGQEQCMSDMDLMRLLFSSREVDILFEVLASRD